MKKEVKLRAGKYLVAVTLIYEDNKIFVKFKYNKKLIAEIKAMDGAKWWGFEKPPRKIWSIANSQRNAFQLAYLQGFNPYAPFDAEVVEYDYTRLLYDHQKEFSNFILSRRIAIIAGEMGTGKTLAVIEVMERSGFNDWWYVAPRSGIRAVERELRIWKSKIQPKMMTYAGLTKIMKEWPKGQKAPRAVVFDESARAKNPTTQRSQAALGLANGIRNDWGDDGYIILMSGAPAPKSPADWWHQCEIACPGYLREGSQMKFKKRLAVIVEKESITGGVYPHLESWRDDEKKCEVCGEYEDAFVHVPTKDDGKEYHAFEPSKNEVSFLYERMKGLVLVKFKKDCLDLPDKIFRTIVLPPSQKIINIAKTILATSPTVIGGITLLRELSDGFQYQEVESGEEECPYCKGSGKMVDPLNFENNINCDACGGKKMRKIFKRIANQIECPKEDALKEVLDEHLDVGRLVVYAGFTGSIDRCVQIAKDCNWEVIRADGRGWHVTGGMAGDYLDIFQDLQEKYPRVVFIGQPGTAGIGLTLTASPTILYYSNDFNFENRIQSMDRIHRPGMDLNRGATIIDLIHLATDQLILNNLAKKQRLQALTMGQLISALG